MPSIGTLGHHQPVQNVIVRAVNLQLQPVSRLFRLCHQLQLLCVVVLLGRHVTTYNERGLLDVVVRLRTGQLLGARGAFGRTSSHSSR